MPKYSKATKAAAMAALLEGQRPALVAKEFPRIPIGTIKSWARRLSKDQVAEVASVKKELGQLVLENLKANLQASKVIIETASKDRDWLLKQSAEGIGVLYGIIADKGARILEVLNLVEGDSDEG